MAINSKLDEYFVTRRKNTETGNPVMDFETPIDVEGEVPAPPATAPIAQTAIAEILKTPEPQPTITEMEEQIEMGSRNPAESGDSNLWYFLPAALGALTGNLGEGSAASASAIGEARKKDQAQKDYDRTLSDKLRMLQMQRKGDSKLYEVEEDGKRIYKTREDAIGGLVGSKPKGGETFEEKVRLYKATRGEIAEKNLQVKKDALTEKESREVRKDFLSDKQVAPTLSALETVKELRVALTTPGWAGAVTAQAKFIRGVLKEVGNLNEQEQQRAGMSPDVENKITQFFNKLESGDTLTAKDRQSLSDIMDKMEKVYIISLEKKAKAYAQSVKDSTGRDVTPVINPFLPKAEQPRKATYEDLSDEDLDRMLQGGP